MANTYKNEQLLTKDELLYLSCRFLVNNYLKQNNFEIENGFPRKAYPNIVCKKDGVTYGIVVIPSVFPNYEIMTDNFRIKTVDVSKKENAVALFAPVGLKSNDEERASQQVILKTDDFKVYFPGFIVLTDDEKQNLEIKASEFVRL